MPTSHGYDPLNNTLDHTWCVCGRSKGLHPFRDPYGDCLTFRCRHADHPVEKQHVAATLSRKSCPDCSRADHDCDEHAIEVFADGVGTGYECSRCNRLLTGG